jgi:hypothetical protein
MPAPRCDEYGTTHALAILRKGVILGNASVASDARNGPEAPVHDNACRGRNLEHAGLIRTFKPRGALRDVFGWLLDRDAGVDPAHAGLAR